MDLLPALARGLGLDAFAWRWPGLAPTAAVRGDLFDDGFGFAGVGEAEPDVARRAFFSDEANTPV